MKRAIVIGIALLAVILAKGRSGDPGIVEIVPIEASAAVVIPAERPERTPPRYEQAAFQYASARLDRDLDAVEAYRPSYPFWQHIFVIPDGAVAFGSAVDGRLLATFPAGGNDPALASLLDGVSLPSRQTQRRDEVASLLESRVGPVVHNATRGSFVLPNVRRYGSFLEEWGAIFERFGVPAEIGLAQAMLESGFNPTIRSEARAVGFCQWLDSNWNRLKRISSNVIEGHNQTTQAMYCAAYLTSLATKYGSFIPALSEHHAGAANVGRTLINGTRLGAPEIREQYFLGARFAVDLRNVSLQRYREIFRTYGPRSALYAEMVFGNTFNVSNLRAQVPQTRIHAMRVGRNVPLEEVVRRTGLSADEVRRFNPALSRQVPANATLYLPEYVEEFGSDVTFWHQPPTDGFAETLDAFVRLDTTFQQWDDPAFTSVLDGFKRRFEATGTEEGRVMAVVIQYVMDETRQSRRGAILSEFEASENIRRLFDRGVSEVTWARDLRPATPTIGPR
jgi:hypothetical protein